MEVSEDCCCGAEGLAVLAGVAGVAGVPGVEGVAGSIFISLCPSTWIGIVDPAGAVVCNGKVDIYHFRAIKDSRC